MPLRTVSTVDEPAADLYAAIGRRLTTLRRRQGLRQQDLAAALALSRAAVANMEAGKQTITIDTLLRLSSALEASPLELVPQLRGTDSAVASVHERRSVSDLASDLGHDQLAWVEDIVRSVSRSPDE